MLSHNKSKAFLLLKNNLKDWYFQTNDRKLKLLFDNDQNMRHASHVISKLNICKRFNVEVSLIAETVNGNKYGTALVIS